MRAAEVCPAKRITAGSAGRSYGREAGRASGVLATSSAGSPTTIEGLRRGRASGTAIAA